jgi:hypothetical protein
MNSVTSLCVTLLNISEDWELWHCSLVCVILSPAFSRIRRGLGVGRLRALVFWFCTMPQSADGSTEAGPSWDTIPEGRRQSGGAPQTGESLDRKERDHGRWTRSTGTHLWGTANSGHRPRKIFGEYRTSKILSVMRLAFGSHIGCHSGKFSLV